MCIQNFKTDEKNIGKESYGVDFGKQMLEPYTHKIQLFPHMNSMKVKTIFFENSTKLS